MSRMIVFALLMSSFGNLFAASVYTWLDEQGVLHFGDRPPALGVATEVPIRAANVADGYDAGFAMRRLPVERAAWAYPAARSPETRQSSQSERRPVPRSYCEEVRERMRSLDTMRRKGGRLADSTRLESLHRSLHRSSRAHCR